MRPLAVDAGSVVTVVWLWLGPVMEAKLQAQVPVPLSDHATHRGGVERHGGVLVGIDNRTAC